VPGAQLLGRLRTGIDRHQRVVAAKVAPGRHDDPRQRLPGFAAVRFGGGELRLAARVL
jgi:hypothetical protein